MRPGAALRRVERQRRVEAQHHVPNDARSANSYRTMSSRPTATAIKARAIQALAFVKTRQDRIVVALLVLLTVILLIWFGVALARANRGENAVALGSLVGGLVGAGGAVWAVFLTLSRQRREETIKVAEAVRTEVAALVKYIIGAIEICQEIKTGTGPLTAHAATAGAAGLPDCNQFNPHNHGAARQPPAR